MNEKSLKNSILQWAIEGKLVPQDPNDEPAEELLKRIDPSLQPIREDVPFDVPQGWCWVRLGDYLDIARGGSPRPIKNYLTNSSVGYNWIKIGDTEKGGKYINSTKEKIIKEGLKKTRLVHKGDFLLTNSMSFGRPYILNVDGCIHDGWLVISGYKGIFTIDFLYYLLSSPFAYKQFCNSASGGVVDNLNIEKVCNSMFPLPPLAEQQRIVSKLEELMPLVERYGKAQEGLDKINGEIKSKLRASILQEAISGKLVPQDPNDEPAEELLKRIDPSFTPQQYDENLPQGWCACQLKDCGVTVLNGYAFKSNEYTTKGVRVIRITNVQDGLIVDDEPKYYPLDNEEVHKYYLREGDLLMSLTGNVGRVGWMPANLLPAALNQRVGCLRFNNKSISKQYLFYFLQSDLFRKDCVNSGKGIAQLNISTEWLKRYILPLPPLAEQERIVKKLEELLAVLDNM